MYSKLCPPVAHYLFTCLSVRSLMDSQVRMTFTSSLCRLYPVSAAYTCLFSSLPLILCKPDFFFTSLSLRFLWYISSSFHLNCYLILTADEEMRMCTEVSELFSLFSQWVLKKEDENCSMTLPTSMWINPASLLQLMEMLTEMLLTWVRAWWILHTNACLKSHWSNADDEVDFWDLK